MVDVWSIIIAILALIVAAVAIVLIFVIPGPSGPTGPSGGTTGTNFAIVGNATASSTQSKPDSVAFQQGVPVSAVIKYTNPTLLYKVVYDVGTGKFTLASGAGGYYTIYTENAVSITLTGTPPNDTTLTMEIMVNEQSVASSSIRVIFEAGNSGQASLSMLSVGHQGKLNEGDSVYIRITVNSLYNGTLDYNFPNQSRVTINGNNFSV